MEALAIAQVDNAISAANVREVRADLDSPLSLMPGECLIVSLAAPFAIPAKVDLYDTLVAATPPAPAARRVAAPNVSALVD